LDGESLLMQQLAVRTLIQLPVTPSTVSRLPCEKPSVAFA
jgi:hypothetical protein